MLSLLRQFRSEVRTYWWQLYLRSEYRRQGVTIHPSAFVYFQSRQQIELKKGVKIGVATVLSVMDLNSILTAPLLSIGEETYIGDHVNIRAANGLVKIGNHCLVANGVTIVSNNHGTKIGESMLEQPWVRGDVTIGDDVWIGANAVILAGVTIADGAVIAAGAVVTKNVEKECIVAGVPARFLRHRTNN